jgi:hypothetical protein
MAEPGFQQLVNAPFEHHCGLHGVHHPHIDMRSPRMGRCLAWREA